MVIKTLEATYTVQSQLPYNEDNRVFVCEKDGDNDLYLLVEIADKEMIRTAVDFLMEAKRMPEFSDFVDCFFAEEYFYAVFNYYNSMSLEDLLKEDIPPLPGRLALMREILEKWMLLKLPPYFAFDSAKIDHIRFTAGNKGVLAFSLSNLTLRDEISFVNVQERLAKLWEKVFEKEFAKESVPELVRFRDNLVQSVYEDIPALFVAYDELERKILQQPEEEWQAEKTWPFRLWDKIKVIYPKVKRVVSLILLIAAFFYLIVTIRYSTLSGGQMRQFDRIGTLEIHESKEQESETEEKGFKPWQALTNLLKE